MIRNFTLLCLPLLATTASANGANTAILDQAFESFGGWGTAGINLRQAQSFTVGITGWLTRAELSLEPTGSATSHELTLSLTKTRAGVPSLAAPDILSSSTVRFPLPGQGASGDFRWIQFDFPSTPVFAGQVLALVLASTANMGHAWAMDFDPSPDYAGGEPFDGWPLNQPDPESGDPYTWQRPGPRGNHERLFRTYVIPIPESSAACLAMLAFLACQCMQRWRREAARNGPAGVGV
jgi:hypothetical protein